MSNEPKKRILNERLAAIVASIRHGEMLFIADAGSGTCSKAIVQPLDPSVEYLDLGAVSGSPTMLDIVAALKAAGDFEGCIVTKEMPQANPESYQALVDLFGEENITKVPYKPTYYQLRDRCKAMIQTGDYGVHAQAVLIAGYSSAKISLDRLLPPQK